MRPLGGGPGALVPRAPAGIPSLLDELLATLLRIMRHPSGKLLLASEQLVSVRIPAGVSGDGIVTFGNSTSGHGPGLVTGNGT